MNKDDFKNNSFTDDIGNCIDIRLYDGEYLGGTPVRLLG